MELRIGRIGKRYFVCDLRQSVRRSTWPKGRVSMLLGLGDLQDTLRPPLGFRAFGFTG